MKILIVDDQSSNRMILKFLLEAEGHECIEAEDGDVGVERFVEDLPDCVLLDIVMPRMDGYQAATEMKKQSQGHHIPIIFLTAKTDEESIVKCLESGGDDYLPKPVNQVMLMAKIRAHGRTQELTEQIRSTNKELTLLHATLQQEHEMGRYVMSHALARSWQDCPNVRSDLSSMSDFNGDLFLVAPKPNGGMYAMLGDFIGHGLGAAIGAMPVSQTFFAMCAKGMAIMDIASSMNEALKAFLPDYMFCAATLIDLCQTGNTMTIWAGGLPDAWLVRPGKGVVNSIKSSHMPMGILGKDEFDDEVQVLHLELGDRLLLYTDGILEGTNQAGEMFGESRMKDTIASGKEGYFDSLLKEFDAFTQNEDQKDDCSLVEIIAQPIEIEQTNEELAPAWLPWSMSFTLDVEQLKRIDDPVLQIINMFPHTMLFSQHVDIIRTILTELFSNALEHGLLGLSSELKSDAEGFLAYYQQREQGLAALEEGMIKFKIDYLPARTDRELRVVVEDTGPGYEITEVPLSENVTEWGRGLGLIRSLCEEVKFSKRGAKVEAYFKIG